MKNSETKSGKYDLHKFVDGELTESQSQAIAERIATDEALRNEVNDYQEINQKLRQTYDEKRLTSVPSRLLLAVSGRNRTPMWRIAASLLWLSVGGLLGYSLHNQITDSEYAGPLPVDAAFAHTVYVPEVLHPVEVEASKREHLNAWLSKRLDRPVAAPDLRAEGYTLIGGRLLPDGHRAAAQFMFEDSAGERMTLYIRQAVNRRETAFLYTENDSLGIVYWVDNGLAYAVTAAAGKALLTETATAVYKAANP
ncbi:MAG: anti-sigma factor [Gammaproteobacteria bacterium]